MHFSQIRTESEAETQALGRELGRDLPIPSVVLLQGSLGSGKTTFTRGLAEGLGVSDPSLVSSPSFTLVNIYHGRCRIYHVDLYRLSGGRDLYSIGLDDFIGKDGVTVVEWGERLDFSVDAWVRVQIEDAGDDSRIISLYF